MSVLVFFARTTMRRPAGLLRMLVVTVAAVAALAGAGPADAIIRGGGPPGEASCPYGGSAHPHGTIITITSTTPGGVPVTHKWRCNNGSWEPVRSMPGDDAAPEPGTETLGPPEPNP